RGRHPVPARHRRDRAQVSARDAGIGSDGVRRRRRWPSGWAVHERHQPPAGRAGAAARAAAVPQRRQRNLRGRHGESRLERADLRDGCSRRRLRQRRPRGSRGHRRRPEPAVPQRGGGTLRRGHRQGLLDLVICNYVRWTAQTDIFCSADGKPKSYCTPEAYPGATSWLYRNKGNATFEDVTAAAGLLDTTSKALGIAMLDVDADGWPDLFVANDTQPNKLYRNKGNRTFQEVAVQAGLAFSEDGRARAGMGTDAADFDNSGVPSIVVTNFSGEMLGLYVPVRRGVYADRAPGSEVGRASRLTLGFGCFFFDADLDGLLDLLVVNGHIDDGVARTGRVHYAEPPHLFHNRGKGQFVDVAREVGAGFAAPKVGRGAAFGDLDLDGDLDVLIR